MNVLPLNCCLLSYITSVGSLNRSCSDNVIKFVYLSVAFQNRMWLSNIVSGIVNTRLFCNSFYISVLEYFEFQYRRNFLFVFW
jgi:hypothetical protein